ncbi:hypothetical protein PINS_up004270 [Pythium insidiosum]|nr:hypothetical protein PINS_up004270 [Pythium insidiosum]
MSKPKSKKPVWEETTSAMNQTTRLQDAASAFLFGLRQGVFMGRDVLEDAELDALKAWLQLVGRAFPGSINRKIIQRLYVQVAPIPLLDVDTWDAIVKEWQATSVAQFEAAEAKLDFTRAAAPVPEWQRVKDLFVGNGATYRACASYTCGQWNLFHMLAMTHPVSVSLGVEDYDERHEERRSQREVAVIATIRRFVKHFFGCIECRDHFLQFNTLETVRRIRDAENKPVAIKRWVWKTHNGVNKGVRHPVWPKPEACPTCGDENQWDYDQVDRWLDDTYEYREVAVPLLRPTPPVAPAQHHAPAEGAGEGEGVVAIGPQRYMMEPRRRIERLMPHKLQAGARTPHAEMTGLYLVVVCLLLVVLVFSGYKRHRLRLRAAKSAL